MKRPVFVEDVTLRDNNHKRDDLSNNDVWIYKIKKREKDNKISEGIEYPHATKAKKGRA